MSGPFSPQKKRRISTSPIEVRAITTTQNSPNQSLTTAFPKLSSTPTKSLTTLINTNTINSPSAPPSYLNMSIGSGGGSGHLSQQDLLIKLVKKEEEVQNLLGELQTLSQTLAPEFSYEPAYRKKFLDPAINALFRTMKMELEEKDKTIENLKRELDGVGFTPNSITGKKLVEKLRTLQNENEELGRQLRQGRVEQYEVEIALQRKVIEELKIAIKRKQSIVLEEEMERLQDLLFQMHAKVNRYEKQARPERKNQRDDFSPSTQQIDDV
ncbi:15453_t:CDS:2 [Entrophospora sp. SA101]|nr:5399_t:CDS:2 [Entrophospora candida]CAG8520003.1 13373_t:CDS:2 [Entrophospora candida]CAJ0627165.1 15453_t:CDS:2 [Entrophospora sp. SA101]CAJ0847070.1 14386_t:CDS:2 [Entrophospora sp. SA101]CAJ0847100.1 14397_t:CDS:2 [Entrophospora sp. SA101]